MSLDQALAVLKRDADDVVETSCATVVLKGDEAFKLKRNVDYGFLDFSTPEKRRHALELELRYNQRTAADIYRKVIEVEGETVLVMRRFDRAGVLGEQSLAPGWSPDLDLMQTLGETIAEFHAASEVSRDETHACNIKYTIDSNDAHIGHFRDALGGDRVDAYHEAIYKAFNDLSADVRARFDTGYIRRCHGDMHLNNILIENGKPVLFDCIEFNEHLIQVDVLYDLGFLLMDLWVRGQHVAANRVFNAWLDRTARLEGEAGLYESLKLLPFYMSARAGVRCQVSAHAGDMEAARIYLDAALDFLKPVPATVSAIGGLSGSGKSTHGRAVAGDKGRAPGAVLLRSDELRKRLWGCPSLEPLPKEAYTAEETVRTYKHMFALGERVVGAGQSVIFDATFRESQWRDAAEAVAATAGATFDGLWLDVPVELRQQRVEARTNDVSDATSAVAASQAPVDPETISWQFGEAKTV